jgi:uncharacterized protein YigA (DUF484 family)
MAKDLSEQRSPSHPGITAEDVADYLARHPEFLSTRPSLLATMIPPSEHRDAPSTGIVDFQHFMVRRLQSDIARQAAEREEMIGYARTNLNLLTRIHACVLALLESRSFEQMIATITGDLAVYLDLDVAALMIEGSSPDAMRIRRADIRVVQPGQIDAWMGRKAVVLRGDIAGDPEIYGESAGLVRSEALLRLEVSRHAPAGMLAFGSRSPDIFQDGQGTELVGFLARVVERCIRAWLDLAE